MSTVGPLPAAHALLVGFPHRGLLLLPVLFRVFSLTTCGQPSGLLSRNDRCWLVLCAYEW